MKKMAGVVVALVVLWTWPLNAQVPHLLNYQAHIAAGDTSLTGTFKLTFSVYGALSGGTSLWTETQAVQVTDGLFNVLLGSVVPLSPTLFSGVERYLGVRVENDAEMTPRQRIVSVGYAFRAETADDVSGRDIAPASVSLSGAGPVIDRQGRWVGGSVATRAVTTDSLISTGGGLVVDRQGRWVGGDVRARVVASDSIVTLSGGAVVDRQGRWVGPPQPVKLNYLAVGPKGSVASPISINANSWADIEAFVAYVTVSVPSLLDIRFDGTLVAGSNCQLRVRVDGNISVGNLSGIDDARTSDRRHTAVGISAVAPVNPGEHQIFLQGMISQSVDGQFLSGQIQNGFMTVRIYAQ